MTDQTKEPKTLTLKFKNVDKFKNMAFDSSAKIDEKTYDKVISIYDKVNAMEMTPNPVFVNETYNNAIIRFNETKLPFKVDGVYCVTYKAFKMRKRNEEEFVCLDILTSKFIRMEARQKLECDI